MKQRKVTAMCDECKHKITADERAFLGTDGVVHSDPRVCVHNLQADLAAERGELGDIKRVLSSHWYRVELGFDLRTVTMYSCRLCDATVYTSQHPDASVADMVDAIKHYKGCIVPKACR